MSTRSPGRDGGESDPDDPASEEDEEYEDDEDEDEAEDEDDAEDVEDADEPDHEPAARRVRAPRRSGGGATPGRAADRADRVGRRRPHGRKGRRSFDSGNVVAKSFSVWFSNFVPFTVLATLAFLPLVIYAAIMSLKPVHEISFEAADTYDKVANLLGNFLHFVVQGSVVFGVFRQLRGTRTSIGQCIAVGLKRLFPVIGVSILMVILMISPFIPGFLIIVTGDEAAKSLGIVLLAIGIVPYLIIRLGLVAAVPTMVVEGGSMVGAIKRSWMLAKGNKGTIWVVLIIIGLAELLLGCLVVSASTAAAIRTGSFVLAVWPPLLFAIVRSGLDATVAAVMYHDLRIAKEGIASEELAAIFD